MNMNRLKIRNMLQINWNWFQKWWRFDYGVPLLQGIIKIIKKFAESESVKSHRNITTVEYNAALKEKRDG